MDGVEGTLAEVRVRQTGNKELHQERDPDNERKRWRWTDRVEAAGKIPFAGHEGI